MGPPAKLHLGDRLRTRLNPTKSRTSAEFLSVCAKEVDRAMCVLGSDLQERMQAKLAGMEDRLRVVERKLLAAVETVASRGHQAALEAKRTSDIERQEKAQLCQWLNGFLATSSSVPSLSAIEMQLARFCLGIALSSARSAPEELLKANVPAMLLGMLSSHNDLVAGPAALALAEVAQHPICQRPIAQLNAIQELAALINRSTSSAVLSCACSALALITVTGGSQSKADTVNGGGIGSALSLAALYGTHPHVTCKVLTRALAVVVNSCSAGGEACKGVAIDNKAVEKLAPILADGPGAACDEASLAMAIRCIGNIAFNHPVGALSMLKANVDTLLCDIIRSSDIRLHSDTTEVAFIALGNIGNTDMNRAHLGGGEAVSLATSVCEICTSSRIVRTAGRLLALLCIRNVSLQARLSVLVPVLTKVAVDATNKSMTLLAGTLRLKKGETHGPNHKESALLMASAAACLQASSIILNHPSGRIKARGGVIRNLIELADQVEDTAVLTGVAACIATIVPEANAFLEYRDNEKLVEIEEAGGLHALERCGAFVYGRGVQPSWLTRAIQLLSADVATLQALAAATTSQTAEIYPPHTFYQEVVVPIPSDIRVGRQEVPLDSLLFKVY